ncbi:MAG: CHC2 zinc finger domain-containing protein [Thermodesulfovibrionales bacterium]|nr:CHC2 zinc finger domain-containing protein [Thermodesulfovibrionales bacterium]
MTNDFERVKEALPELRLIIERETGLKMKGPHLEACPFCGHKDCFSIHEQGYKCFSCDAHGDAFTFIETYRKVDKAEALKVCAEVAGIELAPRKDMPERQESLQERIYRLASVYYHERMLASDIGREWFIKQRGHSLDTLKKLRAGWADGGLLAHFKEQGIEAADVLKYGLANEKGNDYFWKKDVAVFPVLDHAGTVISFTAKDPIKEMKNTQLKGQKKKWFLNYKALGKYQELFVVEGENDVASLFDVGHENVVGTAGAPGAEQPTLIKNFCSGQTVYLWFDRDKQKKPFDPEHLNGDGGPHHIRFILRHLGESNVTAKVITHPGEAKDPDEFIQGLLRGGMTPQAVRQKLKELKGEALTPLEWEIEELKAIPETKDRLSAFKARKLHVAIQAVTSTADQEVYTDLAAKAIGVSVKAVEELISSAVDLYGNLLEIYRDEGGLKKAEPYSLAKHIYGWFTNGASAKFFKTPDKKCWLFYQRKNVQIGNNLDFNTLMLRLTPPLNAIEKPGSTVWYYLEHLCNLHGEPVDLMSWLYTDREKDIIYINLNSGHNKILRIAPDEPPQMIDNGTNEHAVLLSSSPQIRSFEYLNQQGEGEAEGFRAMKSLLMDTSPCEGPQRYFLLCWTISTFLMNYQTDRGLLQIIGSSSTGKSKVAERISQLLYGESFIGKGTGAAETRVAVSNPVLFLDNLENRNLTQGTVDFLLFVANSAHKPKAKSGSDTDVLYQKLNTMGVITSIEEFPGRLPELINRTFPLILETQYKQTGYMHDETMRAILKKRNAMLSAIFGMLAKDTLPRLAERADWSKFLSTRFPGHNKERNNEHICTMLLILEGLLKHLPFHAKGGAVPVKKQAEEILEHWIRYQEEHARQTALSSNTLLTLLDGLAREVCVKIRGIPREKALEYQDHPEFSPHPEMKEEVRVKVYDDPEYMERFFLSEPKDEVSEDEDEFSESIQRFEFIATAAELHTLLNRYCAAQHTRNPYENPNALGARMSNDRDVLEKGGWSFINRKDGQAFYKKVGGHRYWRLSKKMRAGR